MDVRMTLARIDKLAKRMCMSFFVLSVRFIICATWIADHVAMEC
ncbi:hypothetical protein BSLA_03f0737 [Burkholderia stabilis]|nr:hypothetical protein BSLA_03f0737 [Burkholderia stabilis]